MTVIVAAASKHGTTGEIAARTGTRPMRRAVPVDTNPLAEGRP
jgi:hypothetical protein